MIPSAISELQEKGLSERIAIYRDISRSRFSIFHVGILKESEGALVVFTGHQYPLVVRTSEGTWLYAATDIAAMKYRYYSIYIGVP